MSQLIAVIDGSSYSESVCDHTAWIAKRSGGSVAVVHVLGRRDVSSEPPDLSGSIGLGARSELLEELAELDGQKAKLAQKRGRAILDGAKERLAASGVDNVSVRLRHGEVVETVSEFEEVLVASKTFQPVKRALIAFDGGPSAIKAVNYIASSNALADIEYHLLSVGEASADRMRELEGAAAVLQAAGLTATHECLAGEPEEVIAEKAQDDHFDLLVMGAYGHSRIRTMIIGSTTSQLLMLCKIPVLLFR